MSAGSSPLRVVVVDDSATIRSVVRRLLSSDPEISVVAEAADGARAVELVVSVRPDAVVLDIEMPVLDGLTAIEKIMVMRPTPVLVLTARAARHHTRPAFEAIRRGPVELLAKPAGPEGWQHLSVALPKMVRDLVTAYRAPRHPPPLGKNPSPGRSPLRVIRFLAIGASTGGPDAILRLLKELPSPSPAAVLIVQHLAAGFEEGFAEWLAGELGHDVRVASDGEPAAPGTVRLAPPGAHLTLQADETLHLDATTPPRGGHRPSADELFLSCARTHPGVTAGVVLTGMGTDGAEGLAELHRLGSLTLAQDPDSSIVFGMPRAAAERGAATLLLPPARIGSLLAEHLRGRLS